MQGSLPIHRRFRWFSDQKGRELESPRARHGPSQLTRTLWAQAALICRQTCTFQGNSAFACWAVRFAAGWQRRGPASRGQSDVAVLYLLFVSPAVVPADRPNLHEHNYPLFGLPSSYAQPIRPLSSKRLGNAFAALPLDRASIRKKCERHYDALVEV